MALRSVGVEIKEKDLTLIVPNLSTTTGGIAGRFKKGPIGLPILIDSETALVENFGEPDDVNYPEWFAAAEYLKYTGSIYVVRASATDTKTAMGKAGATPALILNTQDDFETEFGKSTFATGTYGLWAAKTPGKIGNSLSVIMVDSGNWDEFEDWSFTNKTKYGRELSKIFAASPRTSSWIEGKVTSGIGAKFSVTNTGGTVDDVTVVSGGSGYSSKSYLEFNGKGSGAAATLVVNDGVITGVSLLSGGTLYDANPTVVITPIAGNTPTAVATITAAHVGGIITTLTITSGGAGYTSGATISFTLTGSTGSGAAASVDTITNGVITDVTVTQKGVGYGTATITATAYTSAANDEMHALVIDNTGAISGEANSVLEVYEGLSKIADARSSVNTDNYYMTVINNSSKYIYWLKAPAAVATATAVQNDSVTGANFLAWGQRSEDLIKDLSASKSMQLLKAVGATTFKETALVEGSDGTTVTDGQIKDAYSALADVDQYDVVCLPCAAFSPDVVKHVIEQVAYVRKDAIAFVSPYNTQQSEPATGNYVQIKNANEMVKFKQVDLAVSDMYAQYAFMDSGWKYIFDRYNNRYRWIPLNGDMAGINARLDSIAEPWSSPGGFDRGGVKNVIKLGWNPSQAERDVIYPKGINPVVILQGGGGVMLFGDRTMTSKPSAFDRVNVRRLFNVIEKSIGQMAKYKLFEINDNFTRTDFKTKVDQYLRNVQSRRGISEYFVQCDASNNTPDVIDRNEFAASIFVKPTRAINFIGLTFVATATGVEFSTVVGA